MGFDETFTQFEIDPSLENVEKIAAVMADQITWLISRKTKENFFIVLEQFKKFATLLNKVKDPEALKYFVSVASQFCIEGQPNYYPEEDLTDFVEIPEDEEFDYSIAIEKAAGEFLDIVRVARILFPLRQELYSQGFGVEKSNDIKIVIAESIDIYKFLFQEELGSYAHRAFEMLAAQNDNYNILIRQLAIILTTTKFGNKKYNSIRHESLMFFLFTGIGTFLDYVFAMIKAYRKANKIDETNILEAKAELEAIVQAELQKNGSIYTFMRIDLNDMRIVEKLIYKPLPENSETEFITPEFTDDFAAQVLSGKIPYHEYIPAGSHGVCPATQKLVENTDQTKAGTIVERLVAMLFEEIPNYLLFSENLTEGQIIEWYKSKYPDSFEQ